MADDVRLKVTPFKDGIYQFGGDIICTYPLLGTTPGTNFLTFHYKPFDIIVSWTVAEDGSKQNPTWQRVYKSSGSDTS